MAFIIRGFSGLSTDTAPDTSTGFGTAYQEVIGVGNGVGASFSLTFVPGNETSILVFAEVQKVFSVDWTYNAGSNEIVFNTGKEPAAGQEVFAFYLTEGETIVPPVLTGTFNVEYPVLTATDISNEFVILAGPPAIPSQTILDIPSGVPQAYNVDFTVIGNQLSWSGLGLSGQMIAGNRLRVQYIG